jgi:hypothetical protein
MIMYETQNPVFATIRPDIDWLSQAGSGDLVRVVSRLDRLEKSLSGMEKRLEECVTRSMEAILAGEKGAIQKHMQSTNARLATIADHLGIVTTVDVGDDDEDRKRLKERLKEALDSQHKKRHANVEKESWMEYIFGICKPDGRLGKKGSR